MVDIYYLGHNCFRVKGKKVTLVVDPFDGEIGFKFPKDITSDIVLCTNHHNVTAIGGNPLIIDGPGEYEIKGVAACGLATPNFNTCYRFTIDGVAFAHLGNLKRPLTEKQIEELDGVDVLMIPVGADDTLGIKEAAEIVAEIEPTIVLPMHFKTIDDFVKASGLEPQHIKGKLSLAKEKLSDQTVLYIFD